jgi:hypothetical protein
MSGVLPAEPLRRLRVLVKRSGRSTSVRFPVSFVRAEIDAVDPPLAHLLRAGDIRLKLHLVLALMATKAPFELDDPPPATWFAGLLDLPDPDGNGARRVNEALKWLHDHAFIIRTRRPGKTPHIRLIHHGSVSSASGRYVRVPLDIWEQGWLLTLPGRALALFLVLKEASGGSQSKSAALTGSRKAQYGLSDDTWTRAASDLEEAGLLETEEVFARASSRDEWGPRRRRQRYTLLAETILALGPTEATAAQVVAAQAE